MNIIAHRGNKRYTPENTMAAFMSAATYPIDGIEFDLQWTKDQIPVVIHDPTIDRTTNGRGKVSSFTLQELKQFDAGSSFDPSFRGEKIPSFSEVLHWAKPLNLDLHVELKQQMNQASLFVESCLYEIEKHGLADRIVISTFYHPYISEIKRQNSAIKTALLTKTPMFRGTKYANKVQADGIHIRHSFQATRYYRKWSKEGVPVRVYRVHRIRDAKTCERLNVDSIITNDPRLMTDTFRSS
ncbi:glycerophosphodiester phosphodiesterase [Salipaludibacillus keqinensis]|uniref:Glycerophosphodiester phosphodiesterase n=1 Tax=Salipaludibacillus keqinensis TaxID=2045207 RepID=A0A323TXE2_9BACI|nr:glycerophosphodiester phosphodiesterase family protein [Salipaludibacillus keqinensis]PYZ94265.1 glycerophosphodiester phosphodiesterase [Salipaludibacillus keqinensis]